MLSIVGVSGPIFRVQRPTASMSKTPSAVRQSVGVAGGDLSLKR